MKLEEIGQQLGITRERVRQIEKKALEKLRQIVKSNSRFQKAFQFYFEGKGII